MGPLPSNMDATHAAVANFQPGHAVVIVFPKGADLERAGAEVGDGAHLLGKRAGAGRKPSTVRKGFLPHSPRPPHAQAHPSHVTMRVVATMPTLRSVLRSTSCPTAIR